MENMNARYEIDRDPNGRLIFQRYEQGEIFRDYSFEVEEKVYRPIELTTSSYDGHFTWLVRTKGLAIIG